MSHCYKYISTYSDNKFRDGTFVNRVDNMANILSFKYKTTTHLMFERPKDKINQADLDNMCHNVLRRQVVVPLLYN